MARLLKYMINYLYPVELYNGNIKESKIVPVSTEAMVFFGLKELKEKYDSGFPKLELDGKCPLTESLEGTRPIFKVNDEGLRQMMYWYLVAPDPHSI